MTLLKWNPYVDLISLQERMGELFGEVVGKRRGSFGFSQSAWSPQVDIFESEKGFYLSAELSGINIEDVEVEVEKTALLLSGRRKFEKNISEENYIRMERFYGPFQRRFNLPAVVDKDGVTASLKNGILKIWLPKLKMVNVKHIKVEEN